MRNAVESVSELLQVQTRINPGNMGLVSGNPEYEAIRTTMLDIREVQHRGYLHTQAAAGELDLPDNSDPDRRIAEDAEHLASQDFDVMAALGGYGLSEGIFYRDVALITYIHDESVALGDFAVEGQEFAKVFRILRTA